MADLAYRHCRSFAGISELKDDGDEKVGARKSFFSGAKKRSWRNFKEALDVNSNSTFFGNEPIEASSVKEKHFFRSTKHLLQAQKCKIPNKNYFRAMVDCLEQLSVEQEDLGLIPALPQMFFRFLGLLW